MTVIINGDTGISGVNGSAGTPAIKGGDADTGIFFGADTASISTGGTSRIHVDSAGNLGIGASVPALKLHVQDGALAGAPAPNSNCDVCIEGASNTGIQFLSGNQAQIRFGDAASTGPGSIIYTHSDNQLRLNFNNSGFLSVNDGSGTVAVFNPAGNLLLNGGSDVRIELGTEGTTATDDRNYIQGVAADIKVNCADQGSIIFAKNGTQRLTINTNGITYIDETDINDTTAFIGNHRYYDKALSTTREGVAGSTLNMQGYYAGAAMCFEVTPYFGDNHPTQGQRYMYFDLVSSNVINFNIIMEVWTGGWSYGSTLGYVKYILSNNRNTVSSTAVTQVRTSGMPWVPKIKNQSSTVCRVGLDAAGGASNVIYVKMTSTKNIMNMIDSTIHFTDTNPF
jgi:hypothetical protein